MKGYVQINVLIPCKTAAQADKFASAVYSRVPNVSGAMALVWFEPEATVPSYTAFAGDAEDRTGKLTWGFE